MVSGSAAQGSGHQREENKDPHSIEEVVEPQIKDRRSALWREKRQERMSEAPGRMTAELLRPIRQFKCQIWNDYMLKRRGARSGG